MANFIWQGRYWKHPNFVYGRLEDGGISVHHHPARIKTLRSSFLQDFIASSERGKPWNIRACAQVLHAEDMLKVKLNQTRFQAMPPHYSNALEAWHNINPIVNPNIQSVADLRRAPI
jgi:hypothetical protein